MIVSPIEPNLHPGQLPGFSPEAMVRDYLDALLSTGYAQSTIAGRRLHLRSFIRWSGERKVHAWIELTERGLEDFRAWIVAKRRTDGSRLAWTTIFHRLAAVRLVCAWAVRTHRADHNPAADWILPRLPRLLPRAVLSTGEMERVLARPDVGTPLGLRDRAIMEVMYSTGIRRGEAVALDCADVQGDRRLLFVREGKGCKDRVVPIGDRALGWVHRYVRQVRDVTHGRVANPALFLSLRGTRIRPSKLTERFHAYIVASGVGKPGSCHIFRHTMATLMHDRGADIRDLQEILGHAELATTQIYTHVSVERLRAVHARTHPAELALRGGVAADAAGVE